MFKKLYNRFCNESIVGRFVYINVAVYIIAAFIGVFSTLFNVNYWLNEYICFIELPASFERLLWQPWSIVTYMFVHERMLHILFNMIALYSFGRIFLNFFSVRHFVGVYLFGGIVGGLSFMLAFNTFPYFDGMVDGAYLVGASASALAILTATATRSPNYIVSLPLFGSMRLVTITVVIVIIYLLLLVSENAGGNFAHLGGVFAGWLFAFMLNKGKDLTSLINKIIDFLATIFKRRRNPKKVEFTYQRGGREADYEYNAQKKSNEQEIDKILEKVKSGGYASLTEEEKKRLFDASQR